MTRSEKAEAARAALEELKQCEVTEEVMQAVREKHAVFSISRKAIDT